MKQFHPIYILCLFLNVGTLGKHLGLEWNLIDKNTHLKNELSNFSVELFLNRNDPRVDALWLIPNVEDSVKFYLYNKKEPNTPYQLIINDKDSLKKSNWNPNIPTKIYIHGYVGNSTVPQMVALKNTLLSSQDDMNVIGMDWGPLAYLFYPIAAHYSEKIGKVGSNLIDFLCTNDAKAIDFHIIGLSLGAHIAGFVANHVKSGRIGRVTGLDPALLGFATENESGRLDKSDADFVDCIHTAGALAGINKPICHADFYPNGGKHPQPGCGHSIIDAGCSHVRAQDLFTESIEKEHVFAAYTCQTLSELGLNYCSNQGALMGYPANKKFQGLFYVKTGSKYPFSNL